jgi:hypothetical protein
MKSLKLLYLATLVLVSTTSLKCFDADNPPNPLDSKNFSLTIFNKTGVDFEVKFILDDKTLYSDTINAGKNATLDIDGRSNKKRAFFYFLKNNGSGKGLQFFYKKIAKARSTKIDTIYLIKTDDNKLLISATEQPSPITTLLVANYSDL